MQYKLETLSSIFLLAAAFAFIANTTSFHFSAVSQSSHTLNNYKSAVIESHYNILKLTNKTICCGKTQFMKGQGHFPYHLSPTPTNDTAATCRKL
jgi:hypothetical protein